MHGSMNIKLIVYCINYLVLYTLSNMEKKTTAVICSPQQGNYYVQLDCIKITNK